MESLRNLLLILMFTCLSSSYADVLVDMQNATETKSLPDVISTTLNPTTTHSTTVTSPFIPTTTVAPKPTASIPPEPKTSLWYVTDKSNNNTCILLEAGIRMTFNYKNTTGQIVKDYRVDVPSTNVNVSGHCGALEQQITLTFFDAWTLSFNVTMNKTDEKYDLTGLSLTYQITPAQFPNALQGNLTKVPQNIKMFKTDATRKYVCISHQTLVEHNDTVGLLSITTYTLSLEAFRNSTSHSFTNSANHCANDEVSQLVPIIVGAALAGLIIIVLIAYVIGRHRARSGYASV